MEKPTRRKTSQLISLETGEVIIEEKNNVMQITPIQAQLLTEINLIGEYIDELPIGLREVVMRRHCIRPYEYDINTFKGIGEAMGHSAYIIKSMYKQALGMLKHMILK